jgi:hypothetical protein
MFLISLSLRFNLVRNTALNLRLLLPTEQYQELKYLLLHSRPVSLHLTHARDVMVRLSPYLSAVPVPSREVRSSYIFFVPRCLPKERSYKGIIRNM